MADMDTVTQREEFRTYQLRAIRLACLVGACVFIAGSFYFDHVQVAALIGVVAFGLAYDKGMKSYERSLQLAERVRASDGDDSLFPFGSRVHRTDGSIADPNRGFHFDDF